MTESALEDRLRRGLSRAAEELPDREVPRLPGGRSNHHHNNHRHGRALVAGIVAAALVAGSAVVALRRGSGGDDVRVADEQPADDATAADEPAARADEAGEAQEPQPPSTPTTKPANQVRATNGQVPGQAVVAGDEIRLYDDKGNQTGTVNLAPLQSITAASSDLDGGFVVCGSDLVPRFPPDFHPRELMGQDTPWLTVDPREIESVDELNELIAGLEFDDLMEGDIRPGRTDQLMWFPAEGEPVLLEDFAGCTDGLQVVDSQQGPMVVRAGGLTGDLFVTEGGPRSDRVPLPATVVATGESRELPVEIVVDDSLGSLRSTMTSGRLLQPTANGLRVVDMATGDELPVAEIDADPAAKYALAPDGRSVAVVDDREFSSGDVDGPVEAAVFDLETGEVLYEGSFDMTIEGLSLSYDGTRLALGSGYEGSDPVTVVDLVSGERRSLGVHGEVL